MPPAGNVATTPGSPIGEEHHIAAGGQRIRVNVRHGAGVPLVLSDGIGASLEVLDPLVEQLDSTAVRFDVPGTGGSPTSVVPYRFTYLAWVLGRVLTKLDSRCGGCAGTVMGWRAGPAVRLSEPAPLSPPRPGLDRHRCADGARPALAAGENADPSQVLGPGLRRIHCR